MTQEEAGWKESLYRMYATGSANMRVAVYGAKHDAAPYEQLLRKFCAVQELVSLLPELMLLRCAWVVPRHHREQHRTSVYKLWSHSITGSSTAQCMNAWSHGTKGAAPHHHA